MPAVRFQLNKFCCLRLRKDVPLIYRHWAKQIVYSFNFPPSFPGHTGPRRQSRRSRLFVVHLKTLNLDMPTIQYSPPKTQRPPAGFLILNNPLSSGVTSFWAPTSDTNWMQHSWRTKLELRAADHLGSVLRKKNSLCFFFFSNVVKKKKKVKKETLELGVGKIILTFLGSNCLYFDASL